MQLRPIVLAAFVAAPCTFLALQAVSAAPDSKSAAKSDGGAHSAVAEAGPRYDPENTTALSEFMAACVAGNGRFLARDFPAAIESYRQAITLSPRHALGHYLLAEAQLAAGNLVEADASAAQAERVSDLRDVMLRGRVLFVLADLKERQKKWDDARLAWQNYLEWSTKNGDAGLLPANANARIEAIDTMLKLEKNYQIVRERIRASADGGVFTTVSDAATESGSKDATADSK